jgi:small-conductance mechanosensitive channel
MRRLSLLLLLAFAAACGGSNDETGPLSRSEYTKRANASCVEAEQKLDALGSFANFKELEKEMKAGHDAIKQSADELRALTPPTQLATRHDELVSLTDETADVATRISAAAGKNDQLEMEKQAERAEQLTKAANDVSRKLGLQECVAG